MNTSAHARTRTDTHTHTTYLHGFAQRVMHSLNVCVFTMKLKMALSGIIRDHPFLDHH